MNFQRKPIPAAPLRDAKGHFAEMACTGGHDACCMMYASEDCPLCEPMCRTCRRKESAERQMRARS